MDPAVEKWFEENEMEDLISVFAGQKLFTFHLLKCLTNDLLREFIPEIGIRVNFMQSVKALDQSNAMSSPIEDFSSSDAGNLDLVNAQVVDESGNPIVVLNVENATPNCSSPLKRQAESETPISRKRAKSVIKVPTHILSQQALEKIKNLDLKSLLKDDVYSSHVLLNYESTGELDDTGRGYIVTVAAKFLINLLSRVTSLEYNCMVDKIIEIFPHEKKSVYFYSTGVKGKNPGGKLPSKVKNVKYTLNKRGSAARNILTTSTVTSESEATLPAALTESDEDDVEQAITSLKHTSLDSWPEILNLWSVTHSHRRRLLDTNGTCTEFNDWDVLKSPNGHLLLSQDYKDLYPGREDLLISKWDKCKGNIISLVRKETPKTDLATLNLLADLDTAPDGQSDPIIISLLASLCCKRGRGNSSSCKTYSPASARSAFLLHIKTANDINRQVKNHMATLYKEKSPFQPIVILVGPSLSEISASYVQVQDVRYNLRTPLAALDTCFKTFFALNLKYPSLAYPIWLFIQQFFYNIFAGEDENVPRVVTVLSSLESAMARKSA